MNTLLLRLAGPMQSWGTQSRFFDRDTGFEPSKSGVLGLLCAAQGWGRDRPIEDRMLQLQMGVRVDREGVLQVDYQTAGGQPGTDKGRVPHASGSGSRTVQSWRTYLADADFLVGVEAEDASLEFLARLGDRLDRPVWPLYLGRRGFVPSLPIRLPDGGLRIGQSLRDALIAEEWRPRSSAADRVAQRQRVRLVLEDRVNGWESRMDQPAPGASFGDRRFIPRYVRTEFVQLGSDTQSSGAANG